MKARHLAVLLLAATPLSAFAYVDPNAGGWLFQWLFPLLAAAGGAWGLLRRRIADWVLRWSGRKALGSPCRPAAPSERRVDHD